MARPGKQTGFTIVELLIVIVVIGILAAIVIVAFNGVQDRAKTSLIQSSANQAAKKILTYAIDNSGKYPSALSDVSLSDNMSNNRVYYQYSSNNAVSPATYCVTAAIDGIAYYVPSADNNLKAGICPTQNLVYWNKTLALMTSTPVTNVAVDTNVFHTSTASLRLQPSKDTQVFLRGSPFSLSAGKTYTISMWYLTDSNWNGGGNSKMRFGLMSNNALLSACGYAGVKTTWTYTYCTYTPSSDSVVSVSVGNDGSTGNVWVDDMVFSSN